MLIPLPGNVPFLPEQTPAARTITFLSRENSVHQWQSLSQTWLSDPTSYWRQWLPTSNWWNAAVHVGRQGKALLCRRFREEKRCCHAAADWCVAGGTPLATGPDACPTLLPGL